MGIYAKPYDERMKELYQEERDNLGALPDADADFIALENTWKRREEEKQSDESFE